MARCAAKLPPKEKGKRNFQENSSLQRHAAMMAFVFSVKNRLKIATCVRWWQLDPAGQKDDAENEKLEINYDPF